MSRARVRDPRDQRKYKAQRLKVLNAGGWVCYYCGQDADTVDHVIPIVSGGDPMSIDNMVPACKRCNSAKGSRSEGAFLARGGHPPVLPANLYPKTTSTVQAGPMSGQPKFNL